MNVVTSGVVTATANASQQLLSGEPLEPLEILKAVTVACALIAPAVSLFYKHLRSWQLGSCMDSLLCTQDP